MKRIISILMAISIFSIFASAETDINKWWEGKRYEVNGISYCINKIQLTDAEYTGAIVVPTDNNELKFSGDVTIPSNVMIDGTTYPVICFTALTNFEENIKDLESLTISEGVKVVSYFEGARGRIKRVSLPSTLTELYIMAYQPDTLSIPGSVKIIGYQAGVGADILYLEDGVEVCDHYSLYCNNKTLTIPGTAVMTFYALNAPELECLYIKKDTRNSGQSFEDTFCPYSYKIEYVINENTTPTKVAKDAFRLASYDDVDQPGMYDRATLYVPKAAIKAYKADAEWGRFEKILAIEDNADIIKKLEGVDDISADAAEVVATEYYDLSGRRLEAPAERGITITATIYSDGTRRCTKTVR